MADKVSLGQVSLVELLYGLRVTNVLSITFRGCETAYKLCLKSAQIKIDVRISTLSQCHCLFKF